jgi:hypothetical protein
MGSETNQGRKSRRARVEIKSMGHGLLPPLKTRSASAHEIRATASRRGIAASGNVHRCFHPVALVLDRGRCPGRPCRADGVSGDWWSDFAGYRTYSLKSVIKITMHARVPSRLIGERQPPRDPDALEYGPRDDRVHDRHEDQHGEDGPRDHAEVQPDVRSRRSSRHLARSSAGRPCDG